MRGRGAAALLLLALAPKPVAADDVVIRLPAGLSNEGFTVTSAGNAARFRIDEETGTWWRKNLRFIHTGPDGTFNTLVGEGAGGTPPAVTGFWNTAMGKNALAATTTGNANTAFGRDALVSNVTGSDNSAFGENALRATYAVSPTFPGEENSAFGRLALADNIPGVLNSAFGMQALRSLNDASHGHRQVAFGASASLSLTRGSVTVSFGSQALVSMTEGLSGALAFGYRALRNDTEGPNLAFGSRALEDNTVGTGNVAFGQGALTSNLGGSGNLAFGQGSLAANLGGDGNIAVGAESLAAQTLGDSNIAVGFQALAANTTGSGNIAIGRRALAANTEGSDNIAVGAEALDTNTTGYRNIAIGQAAGNGQTTGHDNIYIAAPGVAGESRQIKIGTVGTHGSTRIAGIHGTTSASGIGVYVNASGVLGTRTSSRRFKRQARDMGAASDVLAELRPVVFRYREEVGDGSDAEEYGLIAEEVAEKAPALVGLDRDGRPYSVRYHLLATLLLNEMQEQARLIRSQKVQIGALRERVARLRARSLDVGSGEGGR